MESIRPRVRRRPSTAFGSYTSRSRSMAASVVTVPAVPARRNGPVPVVNRLYTRSIRFSTKFKRRSISFGCGGSPARNISVVRTTPRSVLTMSMTSPSRACINSVLPPPMSMTMRSPRPPRTVGAIPSMTRRASWVPEMTSIPMPHEPAAATNSMEFSASLTALVATAR